jgi:hypothetical protein
VLAKEMKRLMPIVLILLKKSSVKKILTYSISGMPLSLKKA